MSAIEPGEKFRVGYGRGRSIEVTALSLRRKRQLLLLLETIKTGGIEAFKATEDALRMAVPDITDEQLDTLDEVMAMEIVSATIGLTQLTEDDQKKSESPH